VGERLGCSATDSVHQQAVRGSCMRQRPVDSTNRSAFFKVATHPGLALEQQGKLDEAVTALEKSDTLAEGSRTSWVRWDMPMPGPAALRMRKQYSRNSRDCPENATSRPWISPWSNSD
jgi:hypothetical protein